MVTGVTAAPPREVELKLLVQPDDLPLLRRNRRVREVAISRASTRTLRSVYFDTRSLGLLERGVTLRVRRVGRRSVQTLKLPAGDGAGLLQRTEIECEIRGDAPDPGRIQDPTLRAIVIQACQSPDFGPILETEVQRTDRLLRVGDTTLRFDLDVGEIRTARGSQPICELELELVAGDPVGLYALALDLQRSARLRVSTRTKFQRGIELVTGAHPSPQRAERLRVAPDATLEEAMEAALHSSLDQILGNEEPARRSVDPEGVHQMRVGIRRLRSALALFREVLPADQIEPFQEELRWLSDDLGRARDLDVFAEEGLAPLRRRFPTDPALKRLEEEAAQMRTDAHVGLRETLDSSRYAELGLHLGHWMVGRAWRQQPTSPASARLFQPAHATARALLSRRYARLRRRGRNLETKGERDKHALRIDAKKLRYAAEFLRGLFPRARAGRFIDKAAELQETLGHLNDAATANELLARILAHLDGEAQPPLLRAAGFVEGWIARAADDQLAFLMERWKRMRRQAPFWESSD
jgi:inorganic triphosphatase YgiF